MVGFDEPYSDRTVALIELETAGSATQTMVPLGLPGSPRIALDAAVHLYSAEARLASQHARRVFVINFR